MGILEQEKNKSLMDEFNSILDRTEERMSEMESSQKEIERSTRAQKEVQNTGSDTKGVCVIEV